MGEGTKDEVHRLRTSRPVTCAASKEGTAFALHFGSPFGNHSFVYVYESVSVLYTDSVFFNSTYVMSYNICLCLIFFPKYNIL